MRRTRSIAVVLGAALALALVSPAGGTVRAAASDRSILKAGVLTAGDVPAGWSGQKQSDVATKNYQGLAICKQIAATLTVGRKAPHALSPRFLDPTASSNSLAQNEAFAFKSVSTARRYLAPFEASNAAACFMQAFNRATSGFRATVTPLTDLQGVGDESGGYEADITGTDQQGAPVHVIADIVNVRVGRAVVGFNFGNNGARLPQAPAIVRAAVARLTALGG